MATPECMETHKESLGVDYERECRSLRGLLYWMRLRLTFFTAPSGTSAPGGGGLIRPADSDVAPASLLAMARPTRAQGGSGSGRVALAPPGESIKAFQPPTRLGL
jgi:hypothetical protein